MTNHSIRDEFNTVRKYSEQICAPLANEDYVPQPVPFVSPPKWHLAHSTWFFETFILKQFQPGYKEYDPDFNFLFNSYYNNIGERTMRTDRGNMTRPTTEAVYAYRRHVDACMHELLERDLDQDTLSLIRLGLHHEQQHQELLVTDIKYILGHNPLFPVYKAGHNLVGSGNTETGFLTVPEGVYDIGFSGDGFCFDNELGKHKVYLHEFEISKGLVTNAEYLEFMNAGGYADFNLWLDEGWSWVNEHAVNAPMYWHKVSGEWHYFTLDGLQKVDPDAILSHVSFYEASAFAQWKQMRLPTEFEWEIASVNLDWGQRWEWTNSAYLPYPGFTKAPGAVGEYNGKFMINQMVLRGASVATSPEHSRRTYRNFFHAPERWQYTGIRLVK
ncbi:ergothioneine biosynthesis protein EgtB [Dyadobacter sp. Leaf189]|uniref:ergothioneine biosynthesis protein EgtB n=1 Tax=Dyadobacter sp. Leaf189 TaxID=1736295 RepID=UPI0006F7E622|nr:ergothioneine biosynthesis protein EgtB [Dyadobacter sp. Leaf189]KQS28036.1 sulfatase maturase [Dyadobacter sp. Leaf189]